MEQYKEIAPRLIGLREGVGWTVEEMADLLGVSKEKVELYESGTVEISVGYLLDVSRLCRVDLTTLISGREPHLKSYAVVRKNEGFAVDRRKDYDYKSLGYKFAGREMEPFLITVPPKSGDEMTETSHRGQEFMYVLEGRLEVRLGGEPIIVESGDSLYFNSETPHALRGLDGKEATFLDVILQGWPHFSRPPGPSANGLESEKLNNHMESRRTDTMFTKQEYASYEDLVARYKPQCPDNFNFSYDVLDTMDPAKTALVHLDDAGTRREYDFKFFQEGSCRLANALMQQGVKKGDRIMLVLYRRVEYWTVMLALHRIGALPIPSPSLLTKKDIAQRVNYAGISAIICEDSICERVDQARSECDGLKLFVQVNGQLNDGWFDYEAFLADAEPVCPRTGDTPGGDDPMVIFFSSGTTGLPKMVTHSFSYPCSHYTTGALWHDLEEGDLHLTLSDTGWAKSVWGKFYGQWMAKAAVFVWDFRGKFEPAELLRVMAENKITTFCAPPTVYRFLVREDMTKYDLSALRHCTTAGELLNESVFHAWEKAFNMPIYEGYGQTETTLQIATFKCMTPKPGSIGKPVPGWDIALMDEEGNKVPQGEEGEICIRIDKPVLGLFDSYMDEPEKTASVKYDDWYHTGDKAWADEDGFFWFMGRTDDLIKSSGYRIGPFEVESALVAHDAVIEAAVTGLPDEVRGQLVKATVVLAPGYEPSDELTKALQAFVRELTAPYKYPRVIDYVADLPKTISGKIKRKEIREADLKKFGKQPGLNE